MDTNYRPEYMPFNESYHKEYYAESLKAANRERQYIFGKVGVKVIPMNGRPDEWLVEKRVDGELFNYWETTDHVAKMLADMRAGIAKTHRERWHSAFHLMLAGNNEKLSESEDFKDVCSQWAIMTNENSHNRVLCEVARFFRRDYWKKQMEEIIKEHESLGHMPWSLIEKRSAIQDELLDYIKHHHGERIYYAVYECLRY